MRFRLAAAAVQFALSGPVCHAVVSRTAESSLARARSVSSPACVKFSGVLGALRIRMRPRRAAGVQCAGVPELFSSTSESCLARAMSASPLAFVKFSGTSLVSFAAS